MLLPLLLSLELLLELPDEDPDELDPLLRLLDLDADLDRDRLGAIILIPQPHFLTHRSLRPKLLPESKENNH